MQAINEFKQGEFSRILSEFEPDDIYNADETGIYYRMLPKRTECLKNDTASGYKVKKDRVSMLLCSIFTETHKLEPLIIENTLNQCALITLNHYHASIL